MGPEPICERRRAGCAKRAFAGPNRPRETRGAVRCPAEPIVERERQSRRPPPPDPDPRLAACGPGTQRPEAYSVLCSKVGRVFMSSRFRQVLVVGLSLLAGATLGVGCTQLSSKKTTGPSASAAPEKTGTPASNPKLVAQYKSLSAEILDTRNSE